MSVVDVDLPDSWEDVDLPDDEVVVERVVVKSWRDDLLLLVKEKMCPNVWMCESGVSVCYGNRPFLERYLPGGFVYTNRRTGYVGLSYAGMKELSDCRGVSWKTSNTGLHGWLNSLCFLPYCKVSEKSGVVLSDLLRPFWLTRLRKGCGIGKDNLPSWRCVVVPSSSSSSLSRCVVGGISHDLGGKMLIVEGLHDLRNLDVVLSVGCDVLVSYGAIPEMDIYADPTHTIELYEWRLLGVRCLS